MRLQKIALEEHIAVPDTVDDSERYFTPDVWPKFRRYLLDIHGQLLADMDACGIQITLLSINSPGIQAIPDRRQAIQLARRANDYMAEQVAKNPARFQALATLPLQDPDESAKEITRCVKELGMKGALINSFSQVDVEDSAVYYDLPQFWPFWATMESLGVPFYLHPRDPLPNRTTFYDGHPWLRGSIWAFGVDTGTHALRLMCSGLFDKYPKLTLILGHLGENLPNNMWRIDNRLAKTPLGIPAKKKISEYMRNNLYFTTSGNFCTQTLINTILEVGVDRILFSADYPFEAMSQAADWLDSLDTISETDRVKIARGNAEKLFGLNCAKAAGASA